MNDNTLVCFGGAIKALGGGRFAGPLVTFTDASRPDLAGDFFDATTDFALSTDGATPARIPLFYNHGLDAKMGKKSIGIGEVHQTDANLWYEGQLNLRDDYEKAVYKLIQQGKLGLSSGAVSHLVDREPVGKAFHIKQWVLAEASLTPQPCEQSHVVSLKSYRDEPAAKSLRDLLSEMSDAEPAAKSQYLGAGSEAGAGMAAVSHLNDRLMYNVVRPVLAGNTRGDYPTGYESADGGGGDGGPDFSKMSDAEKDEHLSNSFDEFRDMSMAAVRATRRAGKTADAAKAVPQFYADPGSGAPRAVQMLAGQPLTDFLKTTGAVVDLLGRRLSWHEGERAQKQGRPISAANLSAMQAVHAGLAAHAAALGGMIARNGGSVAAGNPLAPMPPYAPQTDDDGTYRPVQASPTPDATDTQAEDAPPQGPAPFDVGARERLDDALPQQRMALDDAVRDQYARFIFLQNHGGDITL